MTNDPKLVMVDFLVPTWLAKHIPGCVIVGMQHLPYVLSYS